MKKILCILLLLASVKCFAQGTALGPYGAFVTVGAGGAGGTVTIVNRSDLWGMTTTLTNASSTPTFTFKVDSTVVQSQVGANAKLALKQNIIPLGTTSQYLRGDLSLATFPAAYTDAAARMAHSVSVPLIYNNLTGAESITQAGTSSNGYLSSADWNTFNGKQPAGSYLVPSDTTNKFPRFQPGTNVTFSGIYPNIIINATAGSGGITAGTGDATFSGSGSVAVTFKTVNAATGTFGDKYNVAIPTVNNKGLTTNMTIAQIPIHGGPWGTPVLTQSSNASAVNTAGSYIFVDGATQASLYGSVVTTSGGATQFEVSLPGFPDNPTGGYIGNGFIDDGTGTLYKVKVIMKTVGDNTMVMQFTAPSAGTYLYELQLGFKNN